MRAGLLAWRLLRRDWRAGEVAVLAFALLLAVAASTAVGLFADRLQHALVDQAAELLGADLVVESHAPLPDSWLQKAAEVGLRQAQSVEFPSMAAAGNRFVLVAVKAVSDAYPLRGTLGSAPDASGPDAAAGGIPAPGEAWADARVLSELGVTLGGEVELGRLRLRLTRLVTHEPDRRFNFYNLSPRLLVNIADLPASGLIQPGSRVHYYGLFAGARQVWAGFKAWLQPRLQAGQRLLDMDRDRPELGTTLARAERYLGLATVAVALLSGVAIASATRRYAQRHYDMAAMLRCLGAQRRDVRHILGGQLVMVGLLATLASVALGWLAQEGLIHLLRPLLPMVPPRPGWTPAILGAGSGLLVLLGFAWPALLRLDRLTPLRVLRRDLEPPPPAAWLIGGAAVAVAALLVWRHTEDARLTAVLVAGIFLLVLVVSGVSWLLLVLSRGWRPAPLAWRFALRSLNRDPGRSLAQLVAFALTLAAMALSLVIREDMVQDWHRQLDPQAPNYFVVNLSGEDRERFAQRLAAMGATASRYYPVVRGRLTDINGQPALRFAVKDSEGGRALNRDLSLTWTDALPADNRIAAGSWWDGGTPGPAVSVEQKLAESLGIALGDRLSFSIAGRQLEATVMSLRSLRWDSMTPNFYVIFAPGGLEGFSYSYLSSFYAAPEQRPLLAGLAREFPGITLLDVDQLLRQFQAVLRQVTLAVDGVLAFALAAGLAVLWASVLNQVDERLRDDALLRALGAGRRLVRRSRLLEFALLGALAGGLAAAMAEGLIWVLYRQVLHMEFRPHFRFWLGLPVIGAMLVAASGMVLTRRAVATSPLAVLRES